MPRIHIKPIFLIGCAWMLLLFPLGWIFSWLIAGLVHEAFHCIALRICGCHIYTVTVTSSGAVMETSQLNGTKKAVCCLAGPIGGFVLLVFARYFPMLAIFGFLQSVYNLIPIRPLDGGQALESLLHCFIPEEKAEKILLLMKNLFLIVCVILCALAAIILRTGIAFLVAAFLIIRNK